MRRQEEQVFHQISQPFGFGHHRRPHPGPPLIVQLSGLGDRSMLATGLLSSCEASEVNCVRFR